MLYCLTLRGVKVDVALRVLNFNSASWLFFIIITVITIFVARGTVVS
jgi:hypothetical protein